MRDSKYDMHFWQKYVQSQVNWQCFRAAKTRQDEILRVGQYNPVKINALKRDRPGMFESPACMTYGY